MRTSWSIRSHLLALVFLTLLPLVILLVITVRVDVQRSFEVAERSSVALAEATATSVARFLRDVEVALTEITRRPEVLEMDSEPCGSFLRDLTDILPHFANLFVARTDAEIVCSALPPAGAAFEAVSDRDWFGSTLEAGRLTIGAPQIGRITGRWVTVFAVPVRGTEGETLGVLGASLDLIRFQDFLVAGRAADGSTLTIDDMNGVVVARSLDPDDWVGRALPTSGLPDEVLSLPQGATRAAGAEGVDRVWGFASIPGAPWRAWAGIPVEQVYRPVRDAAIRKTILVFLALLMLGGTALVLHRRIRGPLDTLMAQARRVGRGSTEPLTEEGPREVAELARQFNATLAALRDAETARVRHLERYRSILENAVFGIVVTDHRYQVLEANPALARILGLAHPDDLRGTSLAGLFLNPDEADARLEAALALEPSVREGSRGSFVEWFGPDGVPVTVRLVGTRHLDPEGFEVREWLVEDVTEQLRMEERLREGQKLEAVGRLAGGVAHDFNNLLTVITTATHLLRDDHPDDPRVETAADDILTAAARGSALTRQLLTFSRRQVVLPEPLLLGKQIEGMEALLRRVVGDDMDLHLHLRDGGEARIEADPGQVEQVILNLVLNARDASPSGADIEVESRVEVTGADTPVHGGILPPGRWVVLEVRDQGTGIPPEIRDRVFEPFFSTKEETHGTGLGLATVHGIATQGGGGVTLARGPAGGTTVRVWFPALEATPRRGA